MSNSSVPGVVNDEVAARVEFGVSVAVVGGAANRHRVALSDGSAVIVRRLRRSVQSEIMSATRYDNGASVAAIARYQLAVVCVAVVGAEGLRHCENGEVLNVKPSAHAQWGTACDREVYDALPTGEDVDRVFLAAIQGLSDEQKKP